MFIICGCLLLLDLLKWDVTVRAEIRCQNLRLKDSKTLEEKKVRYEERRMKYQHDITMIFVSSKYKGTSR